MTMPAHSRTSVTLAVLATAATAAVLFSACTPADSGSSTPDTVSRQTESHHDGGDTSPADTGYDSDPSPDNPDNPDAYDTYDRSNEGCGPGSTCSILRDSEDHMWDTYRDRIGNW